MQHFNLIDEDMTIYDSLALINKNFESLLSCYSGANQPVADGDTPISPGMLWYNTTENKVYQLGNVNATDWRLVNDLSGTGTTKEYVDVTLRDHNHDSIYLKINSPAIDVISVNGRPATDVIFKDNISDIEGDSSKNKAPSCFQFNTVRQQMLTFIDTLGDPDEILKQLKELLKLIDDNTGNLDNLGIDNIRNLRDELNARMLATTTLEDLGGVRADGTSPNGFTGSILFNNDGSVADSGRITVGRTGKAALQAVRRWDDGGVSPDAVQFGDVSAPTRINALTADDIIVSVGGSTNYKLYNEGNLPTLDADLVGRDFLKKTTADGLYLGVSDTAVNSQLLNGFVQDPAQSNNSIVQRNSVGDIISRYFRTNAGAGVADDVVYFLTQRATGTGGDNYARPVSLANVKTKMGINNLPNWSIAEFDARYINADGDNVTGDFEVNGNFRVHDFAIFDLPTMNMGSGGVTDEYLVIAKRYSGTNLPSTGVSGLFKFQRGSATDAHALSTVHLILSCDYDNDFLGLFDISGTKIMTSIDIITIGGVEYYAAKMRSTGGGHNLMWQFEGAIFNEPNDSNILKRVRLSDSNVGFVSQKWVPGSPINSFNLYPECDKRYFKLSGGSLAGDISLDDGFKYKYTGVSGFENNSAKRTFWDHGNQDVTLSAAGSSGNLYLGYNSGHLHQTDKVVMSTDLYASNASTRIVSAAGQLFSEGSPVWTSANDGAGSGLNADTVDGIQGASLLRSDQDDTMSGRLTLTYGSQFPLTISGSNDAKINLLGSTNPYIRFNEGSTAKAYVQWQSAGMLALGNQEDGSILRLKDDLDFTTGDGNWHSIWHEGNDGAGSGLDADTVDGIQAANFARSDVFDYVQEFRFDGGIGAVNNTNNHASAWNRSGNVPIMLKRDNNALATWVDGGSNTRHGYIQVGHYDPQYASTIGQLTLNPFGGAVNTGGNLVAKGYVRADGGVWVDGAVDGNNLAISPDNSFHNVRNNNTTKKYCLWGNDSNFVIGMTDAFDYGYVTKYATTFSMGTGDNAYGWIFRKANHTTGQAAMSLSTEGKMKLDNCLVIGSARMEAPARAGLMGFTNDTTGWSGITVGNVNEDKWSVMADGGTLGLYNETKSDWHLQCIAGGTTRLYHNNSTKFSTESYGAKIAGTLLVDNKLETAKAQNDGVVFGQSHFRAKPSGTTNNTGATSISLGTSTADNYGWTINAMRTQTDASNPELWFNSHFNSTSGNTRVKFTDYGIKLGADKRLIFDNNDSLYMRESNAGRGTVSVFGRTGSWAGYSIEDKFNFMSDGTSYGLYDDVANKWGLLCRSNSYTKLYYSGGERLSTTSTGIDISGTATADTPTADDHLATKAYVDANAGGAGTPVFIIKTANFTAVKEEGYLVDVSSAGKVATLPASPAVGDWVSIGDYNGSASQINKIYITSTEKIHGADDDVVISNANTVITFSYIDATEGWKVIDGIGELGGKGENTASLGENGWHKDAATGMITQWGKLTGNKTGTATFPVPFPNSCFNVNLTQYRNSTESLWGLAVQTVSKTSFNYNKQYGSGYEAFWFAIGH